MLMYIQITSKEIHNSSWFAQDNENICEDAWLHAINKTQPKSKPQLM